MHKNMKIAFFAMFCLYFMECVKFSFASPNETSKDFVIYQRYVEMDKQLKKAVSQGVKYMLPYFLEMNENVNISLKCMNNILTLTNGVRSLKLWALSVLDATGKVSDGILSGNSHMLGDFDLCLKAKALKKNGELNFRGQYCLVQYQFILPKPRTTESNQSGAEAFINATRNEPDLIQFIESNAKDLQILRFNWGLCVPSGCSKQDVGQAVKYFSEKLMLHADVQNCQVEGSLPPINKRNIIIICIFSSLGFLGVISSVVEFYSKSGSIPNNPFSNILLCFSITRNFPKVISTKTSESTISCLHGIRVLSIFWIILSHQILTYGMFPKERNSFRGKEWVQQFFSQIIINGALTVDVLFFIGGLLHCFTRARRQNGGENEQSKIINYTKFFILRLWRLAPAYVFSVLIAFLFVPRGPMAPFMNLFLNNCEHNWWWNALFIHNFSPPLDMCFAQAWYISADTQLFTIALFSIGLLLRNPKKGAICNAALLVFGVLITLVLSYVKRIPPSLITQSSEDINSVHHKYFQVLVMPFPHASSYFFGVFLGYILATKEKVNISKVVQFIGWFAAASCFLSVLFITKRWHSGVLYTQYESSLYFTFSRTLLSLSIGWMILCCAMGYGGIVNYILSLKVWVPLSRISYSAYLLSLILQTFYALNQRSSSDFQAMIQIWQHMGDIAVTCLLSLVFAVIVESPFIALQKLILGENTQKVEVYLNSSKLKENSAKNEKITTQLEMERNKNILFN